MHHLDLPKKILYTNTLLAHIHCYSTNGTKRIVFQYLLSIFSCYQKNNFQIKLANYMIVMHMFYIKWFNNENALFSFLATFSNFIQIICLSWQNWCITRATNDKSIVEQIVLLNWIPKILSRLSLPVFFLSTQLSVSILSFSCMAHCTHCCHFVHCVCDLKYIFVCWVSNCLFCFDNFIDCCCNCQRYVILSCYHG